MLRLLNRPQVRDLIERATAAAVASDPSRQAVALRISVLEAEQRRQDLEKLLEARVEAEKSAAELTGLQETARRLGFDRIEARANERMAPLTSDPGGQDAAHAGQRAAARIEEGDRRGAGAWWMPSIATIR